MSASRGDIYIMSDTVVIKSAISKDAIIKRVSELSGNHGLRLSAPFSGKVRGDRFRLSRTRFLVHPFIPVALGHVKSVGDHAVIEFSFAFPWLGHASVIMIIAIVFSMPLPSLLLWEILTVVLSAWIFLTYRQKSEKVGFLKLFKKKILE